MAKNKLAKILDSISRKAPKDTIVAFSLEDSNFFVYDKNYGKLLRKLKEENYKGIISIFYNYDSKKIYSHSAVA